MRHPSTPHQPRSQRLGARLLTLTTASIGVCHGSLAASMAILATDRWQTSPAAVVTLVAGLAAGLVAAYTLVRWLDITGTPAWREAADVVELTGPPPDASPAATYASAQVG